MNRFLDSLRKQFDPNYWGAPTIMNIFIIVFFVGWFFFLAFSMGYLILRLIGVLFNV